MSSFWSNRAAALLDRMMNGEAPPEKPLRVAPHGVITRHSTDIPAIDDRHVAGALRFIREHACNGIRSSDVVRQVPISRVTLASRFKAAVGHTIGREIQRVQVRQAAQLLATTGLPIKQIARRAGFNSVEYMTRLFARRMDTSPAQYRKQMQTHLGP